jgi:dTDP-4-amino-4,6-dideoxygalactose transaminase
MPDDLEYNHAYYPAIFASEAQALRVLMALGELDIHPRRYFYPSLNTIPYMRSQTPCPVAEDISKRILCLPLSAKIDEAVQERICTTISEVL